jgi:hypothetical protein
MYSDIPERADKGTWGINHKRKATSSTVEFCPFVIAILNGIDRAMVVRREAGSNGVVMRMTPRLGLVVPTRDITVYEDLVLCTLLEVVESSV